MNFRDRLSHEEPSDGLGYGEDIILDTDIVGNDELTAGTLVMGVDCDDLAKPFKMVGANADQLKVSDVNTNILLKDVLIELKKLNFHMEAMTEINTEDHFKN